MKRWTRPFLSLGSGPTRSRADTRGRVTSPLRAVAALSIVALVLAACSSSSGTATAGVQGATGTPAVTSTPAPATATATATVAASSSSSAPSAANGEATGVPVAIDPCTLLPAQEASQLASASFGAGVESTTAGNGRICTYGGQTLNVFDVIVGQEPDVATAQAGEAEAQAQLLAAAGKGIQFTELPNFADGAAYTTGSYTISGQKFNVAAFYALKGTVFFGFSDLALNTPSPTAAAMQAEAQTVLGRLP
jgi:hypothetical protein